MSDDIRQESERLIIILLRGAAIQLMIPTLYHRVLDLIPLKNYLSVRSVLFLQPETFRDLSLHTRKAHISHKKLQISAERCPSSAVTELRRHCFGNSGFAPANNLHPPFPNLILFSWVVMLIYFFYIR